MTQKVKPVWVKVPMKVTPLEWFLGIPTENGEYYVETNMNRKLVVNFNTQAGWCPQDVPMWADGERPRLYLKGEYNSQALELFNPFIKVLEELHECLKNAPERKYEQDLIKIVLQKIN